MSVPAKPVEKPWGYAMHQRAQPRLAAAQTQPQPPLPPSMASLAAPSSALVSPRASKLNRQFGSFALAQKLIEAEQAQHQAARAETTHHPAAAPVLDPDALVPLVWESDESAESSTRNSSVHASPRIGSKQMAANTARAEAAEHHAAGSASPARPAHSRAPSVALAASHKRDKSSSSVATRKPALAYVRPLKPETIDRLKSRLDQLPPPIAPHPLSPHAGQNPVLSRSHHGFLPTSGALVSSTSTTSLPPPLIDVSAMSEEEVALNAAIAASAERHTSSSLPRRSMPTQLPPSRSHQLQTELLALIRPLANQQAAGTLTALSHDTIAQMKRLARELRNAGSNLGVDSSLTSGESEIDGRYPASLREMAQQEPLSSFEATTAPLLELLAPHVQSTLSVLSEASRKRREQLESLKPWQHAPAFHAPSALTHFADQAQQLKHERQEEEARAALAEEKQQHQRRTHSPSRQPAAAAVDPAYATSLSLSLAAQSLAGSASGHSGSKWARKPALLPKESRRVPYQSHVTSLKRAGRIERAEAAMPPEPPTGQPQPSRPEETKEAAGKNGRGAASHVLVHDQLFVDDVAPAALMRAGLANFEEVVSDQLYSFAPHHAAAAVAAPADPSVAGWAQPNGTAAVAAGPATPDVLPFPTRTGSREGLSIRSRSRSRGTKDGSVSPSRASRSPPKALQFRNQSNPHSREVVSPLRPASLIEHFPLPGSPNSRAAVGVTPSPAGSTANTPLPGSSRRGAASRTPTGGDGFLSSLLEEILPDIALWRAQQQKEEIKRRRREQREKARLQAAKLQEEQQQAEQQEEHSQQHHQLAENPVEESSAPDQQAESSPAQHALQTAVVLLADGTSALFTPTPSSCVALAHATAAPSWGSIESVATTAHPVSAFASVSLPPAAPDVLTIDHVASDEFAALSTTMHSASSMSAEINSGIRRAPPEDDGVGEALRAAAAASEQETEECEWQPGSEGQTTDEILPASVPAPTQSSLSLPLRSLTKVVSHTVLPSLAETESGQAQCGDHPLQSLSARVMSRRSSTDAALSASPSSAAISDLRVHRSYTHSLLSPHTQSKLVEILQSMPPPHTGSQTARAVMYGGTERLILPRTSYRSNHSAFTRSFVPATVLSVLRPRMQSADSAAELSVPSVRLPAVFSASAASHAFQSMVAARARSMLQLRRLHAEVAALQSPDDPARHTPMQLRLLSLPRLQSRLAAQLVDCRVQCNDMSAALQQAELPTLAAQCAAARLQLQQDMVYLREVQEMLSRS